MISKHFFCFVVFFINLKCIPASETYKSIIWDPENPLFLTGNSTTCSHKYKRLKIRSASKIKFICPNVATVLRTTSEEVSKTNKFENLWLLYNRESFDKCDTALDINVTKPLFQCTNPTQLEFHSITFQRFAALPDEQLFEQGHSYYIIATSNGKQSHIDDTSGGHCNDTNVSMRIEVYVCNNTEQVEDKMCETGVGELTCPDDTSSSTSVSTPTPSTAHVTVSSTPSEARETQIPKHTAVRTTSTTTTTTTTEGPPEGKSGQSQGFQKGESNGENEIDWMVTAFVFIFLCFVIVIAAICYFFCLGKKKGCDYETRKVEPSCDQYGRKNPAYNSDELAEHETGSLPDKETGVVIYNKEVFYNKEGEGEIGKKNPPV